MVWDYESAKIFLVALGTLFSTIYTPTLHASAISIVFGGDGAAMAVRFSLFLRDPAGPCLHHGRSAFCLGLWLTPYWIVAGDNLSQPGISYLAMINAREFLQTDVVVVAISLCPARQTADVGPVRGWNAAGYAGTRRTTASRRQSMNTGTTGIAGTPLLKRVVTKRYGENTILNAAGSAYSAGQFVAIVGAQRRRQERPPLRLLAGPESPNGGSSVLAGTNAAGHYSGRYPYDVSGCATAARKTVIDTTSGWGSKDTDE